MGVRTYDPKKVDFFFNGVLVQGFARGTFIKASRDNDAFTKGTGSDGMGFRAKSNDQSGSVEVTLLQVSPSNDELTLAQQIDEQSGDFVGPLTAVDRSGRTVLFAETAWVRKLPDVEFADEHTNRVWIFDTDRLEMFVAGNGKII